jgi:hypothetical protein
MDYTNFITIKNNEGTSYTFGYLWYKESESNNERHLYLGKSGKGSCIHIVYIVDEMVAFKTNIGYFKECDINKSLKRGAGGTYLMIFCAMYLLIKKYPQCKLIDWTDNSMISLRINNKEYDVSLNDSDTIINSYPRIQDVISKESIVFTRYPIIIKDFIKKLSKIKTSDVSFNEFYDTFYKPYNIKDLFTSEEFIKIEHIYNTSKSLLEFFKVADDYLTTVNKKKYIFIPLQEILDYYEIIGFIGMNWTVDIHKAFNHIKQKYNISFSRYQVQSGHGYGYINKLPKPIVIQYKNRYFIKNKSYYLPIYRKLIEKIT